MKFRPRYDASAPPLARAKAIQRGPVIPRPDGEVPERSTAPGDASSASTPLIRRLARCVDQIRVSGEAWRALSEEHRAIVAGTHGRVDGLRDVMHANRGLEAECRRLRQAASRAEGQALLVHRHLERLQAITSDLAEAESLEDIACVAGRHLCDAIDAHAVVLVVERDGELVAIEGIEPSGRRLPADRTHVRTWTSMSPTWPSGTSSTGRVPLTRGTNGRGVLAFHLRERRSLTASERDLVENMARQLSLAVHRAALFEAVRAALQSAHEANRAKDEFLAMLGHELRNPLSPMLMSVEVMRQRGPDARALGVLDRQIRHVVRLVDDLLDVSRFARGRMPLARRPIEIADVVARAVELVGPRLEEAGHELALDVPTEGLRVDVDPQRLAQAIGNLLVNAAKFTPPGGHVLVSADSSGDRVRVHVQDDGAGLDEALLSRVFEPFVQGEQTFDGADTGLGLGLAIVQRVAEAHGGRASASSPGPGQGSTFTIELPAAARHHASSAPPAEAAAPSRPPPASCERITAASIRAATEREHDEPSGIYRRDAGRRVLVVDDNRDSAEMMTEILRAEGHQVMAAYDGVSALEMAVKFQPEIALIDIGLPGMTGYDLARRLLERARGRPMRLVAVTGYGDLADQLRARDAGFDLHVTKPPDVDQLAAIVAGAPKSHAVPVVSAQTGDGSRAAAS